MTVEDEEGYEIAEKYLRKKYGDDYVDFLETEGQSYLDGLEVYKDIVYKLIEILYNNEDDNFKNEISLKEYIIQTIEKIK